MDGETTRPTRSRPFYLAHLIAALKTPQAAEPPETLPVLAPTTAQPHWAPSPGFAPLGFALTVPA